ncbi:hypothetical protein C8J56DRAFT_899868 [Mycena floridula]|nr:hypothetical protein C8J56DRAFT_899868 [Mycena floridula]
MGRIDLCLMITPLLSSTHGIFVALFSLHSLNQSSGFVSEMGPRQDYETHLWARLLGGTKIRATIIKESNADKSPGYFLIRRRASLAWNATRAENRILTLTGAITSGAFRPVLHAVQGYESHLWARSLGISEIQEAGIN